MDSYPGTDTAQTKFYLPLSFLSLATCLLALIVYLRKKRLGVLQRCGIPCPPPNFFYGNLKEYLSMGNLSFHRKLVGKYGPITGYYLGAIPYVVIADQELLHSVLVSDSKIFLERPRRIPNGVNPDPRRKRMLAHLPVEEWQKVRKVLSPSFNQSKLKKMLPNVKFLINIFMNRLESQLGSENSNEINFGRLYQTLSLDLISQSAFGRTNVTVQENEDDELFQAVRHKYNRSSTSLPFLTKLSLCLPELSMVLEPLRVWANKLEAQFGNEKKSAQLWDLAMDAVKNSIDNHSNNNTDDNDKDDIKKMIPNQFITLLNANIPVELMVAYSVNAFQGDYENITSTLGFITHLLAKHPEVQQKIRSEVSRVAATAEDSYDFLANLKYTESVIYEALRLWPQTTLIRRRPAKDFLYVDTERKKYILPKGIHIQVAHFEIQRDKNIWTDPEEFRPDRFFSGGDREKVSPNCSTYQGFGSGPRHCMGQKFALLCLKEILSTVVSKYVISSSENSGDLSQFTHSTMNPNHDLFASITPLKPTK